MCLLLTCGGGVCRRVGHHDRSIEAIGGGKVVGNQGTVRGLTAAGGCDHPQRSTLVRGAQATRVLLLLLRGQSWEVNPGEGCPSQPREPPQSTQDRTRQVTFPTETNRRPTKQVMLPPVSHAGVAAAGWCPRGWRSRKSSGVFVTVLVDAFLGLGKERGLCFPLALRQASSLVLSSVSPPHRRRLGEDRPGVFSPSQGRVWTSAARAATPP